MCITKRQLDALRRVQGELKRANEEMDDLLVDPDVRAARHDVEARGEVREELTEPSQLDERREEYRKLFRAKLMEDLDLSLDSLSDAGPGESPVSWQPYLLDLASCSSAASVTTQPHFLQH